MVVFEEYKGCHFTVEWWQPGKAIAFCFFPTEFGFIEKRSNYELGSAFDGEEWAKEEIDYHVNRYAHPLQ